jgi:TATA-box binding protein (TBP) (component of TFIID and TFIIIB)
MIAKMRAHYMPNINVIRRTCANLVASCSVGFKINQAKLAQDNHNVTYTEYTNKALQSAIITIAGKMVGDHITLLAFKSGRVICVGCKTPEDITSSYAKVYGMLEACRIDETVLPVVANPTKALSTQISMRRSIIY